MVKNKSGGSGHKKMARKNVKDYGHMIKTRFPSNEDELISKVTKINGQGTCEVLCNDMVVRLCYIRKKFSGRNKRDNFIAIDNMVLVGKREWATTNKKKLQKVDLLYVYNSSQLEQIKKSKGFCVDILPESEKPLDNVFDITEEEDEYETKTTIKTTKNVTKNVTKTDFDFDDI
tara:strand:- start:2009 stop:2530 length:522 start_codon:yes stop_codon:yes gene_type:complete